MYKLVTKAIKIMSDGDGNGPRDVIQTPMINM